MTKRNKFWTFVFSFLPGAGHMFMGFMKMGVSFMTAFFAIFFLSSWLNIGPLIYLAPILWFYSFFDCLNKSFASDEQFARLEDHYFFTFDDDTISRFYHKNKLYIGIAVLFVGIYLLLQNFLPMVLSVVFGLIGERAMAIVDRILYQLPQVLVAVGIVLIGIKLIVGKKKESEEE